MKRRLLGRNDDSVQRRRAGGTRVLIARTAAFVAVAVSVCGAQVPAHFDPRKLPVGFTGEPWYIELAPSPDGTSRNGVSGGPVSDYGSHFGVKANLWQHRPLYLANYAAVPGLSRKIDRSAFDVLESDGRPIALARQVEFTPWGWRETAEAPGVSVSGTIATLDTNAFLAFLNVSSTRPVKVRLRVFADDDTNAIQEGIFQSLPTGADARFDRGRSELVVRTQLGDQTVHGALASGGDSYRVYRLSFPVESTSFAPGLSTYSFDVVSEALSGTATLAAVLGVGSSEDAARGRTDAGATRMAAGPAVDPAAFQFGWSSALIAQALLGRHEDVPAALD